MRDYFIAIAVLCAIIVPVASAAANDFQSATGHYNQYSTDNIGSSSSRYGSQYSASEVSNPYSQYEVQFAPKNVIEPFAQTEHDYKANLISPERQAEARKARKKNAEELAAAKFLEGKKSGKVPVFFFMLVISSLALVATVFVIIGVFKK